MVDSEYFIGNLTEASWIAEATYGTYLTVNKPFGILQEFSPSFNHNTLALRTIGGNRDVSQLLKMNKSIEASMMMYIQDGMILEHVLGTSVDAGIGGGLYTHTMIGSNTLDGISTELTMEKTTGDDDLVVRLEGGAFKSCSFEATAGEPVKFSGDLVYEDLNSVGTTKTVVAQRSYKPFIFYEGSVLVNGVPYARVNSWNFDIDNGMEVDPRIASEVIKRPVPTSRVYKFSMDYDIVNNAINTIWADFSAVTVVLTCGRPTLPHTMVITLSSAVDNELDFNLAVEGVMKQAPGFIPQSAQIVVTDDIAAYPTP